MHPPDRLGTTHRGEYGLFRYAPDTTLPANPPTPWLPNGSLLLRRSGSLLFRPWHVVDVDCDDRGIEDRLRALALEMLGPAPVRVRSNSPRCMLVFRAAQGSRAKRKVGGKGCGVEVLTNFRHWRMVRRIENRTVPPERLATG